MTLQEYYDNTLSLVVLVNFTTHYNPLLTSLHNNMIL